MKFIQYRKAEGKVLLDLKDRKILCLLAENARTPYSQIARQAGTSRDTVAYRIERLKRSGVIQGYRTIINAEAFGYTPYHIFLQLNQPSKEAEEKLIEAFKKYGFVRAVIKFNGKYDFELAIIAKNIKELDDILTEVMNDTGKYLMSYELLGLTKSYKAGVFPEKFLSGRKSQMEKIKKQPKKAGFKMDSTDARILGMLAEDATVPLHGIAQKCGISADAVNYRIKKMMQAEVIKGFVPIINYDAINYNVYAVLVSFKNLTAEKENTLKQFLNTNENILWAVKTIGKFNTIIYICTTNPSDLHAATSTLRNYFTDMISDYETLINYEEYKYTYLPESMLNDFENLKK